MLLLLRTTYHVPRTTCHIFAHPRPRAFYFHATCACGSPSSAWLWLWCHLTEDRNQPYLPEAASAPLPRFFRHAMPNGRWKTVTILCKASRGPTTGRGGRVRTVSIDAAHPSLHARSTAASYGAGFRCHDRPLRVSSYGVFSVRVPGTLTVLVVNVVVPVLAPHYLTMLKLKLLYRAFAQTELPNVEVALQGFWRGGI